MKRYKVMLTEPALEDLQEIVKYISNEFKEPAIAKRLVGKIKEAVMSLVEMPTRHAIVTDERLASQEIRKLMVENYIVFYVISEKDGAVTVIRVLYGRRDWENLLDLNRKP